MTDAYIAPMGEHPALPEGWTRIGYLTEGGLTEPPKPGWDDSWPVLTGSSVLRFSIEGEARLVAPKQAEPDKYHLLVDGELMHCPRCGTNEWFGEAGPDGTATFTPNCAHGRNLK